MAPQRIVAQERSAGVFVLLDTGNDLYYVNVRKLPRLVSATEDELADVTLVDNKVRWPALDFDLRLGSKHAQLFQPHL